MDISLYFEPLELPDFNFKSEEASHKLGDLIRSYVDKDSFPEYGRC